jgi:hypothetical protein
MNATSRRSRLRLIAILSAVVILVGMAFGPWTARPTHGQTEDVTSTYTYDPTSAIITMHVKIDRSDFGPVSCIAFLLPDALGIVGGPPGWIGQAGQDGTFIVSAGQTCGGSLTVPNLQIGTDYTFLIQMRPGTKVDTTIKGVVLNTMINTTVVFGVTFTSNEVLPTSTPVPAAPPTSVPAPTAGPTSTPVATATPISTATSTPLPTATPLPSRMKVQVKGTLHVSKANTLTVRVESADDGSPIADADVTVDAGKVGAKVHHGTTNAKGQATFKNLRASKTGTITVTVSKEGFETATVRVHVKS